MSRATPILAMLWENWRLTRVEAVQRFALGIVAGSLALTFSANGAKVAFWILILLHSMIWFSIARLNGGKFTDGYKPGFPFHLWYTKPLSTVTLVSVLLLYDAITCTALYLASAVVLGLVFGQPLPLSSVILLLVSYHFAYASCQWATRNRVVQWIGSIAFSAPMFLMLFSNVETPLKVEFSWLENAVFVAIGAASFVLAVFGVARQRRGDSIAFDPQRKAASGGFPDWMIGVFRLPCPTTSPMKAQVWFELQSSGLPVLLTGLVIALLILLSYAVSVPISQIRPVAIAVTVFAVPFALFGLGGNAFGIRRKQGRAYVSPFEMTQPYGTDRAAAIKVLVRTGCVLAALTLIGASLWASTLLLSAWSDYTVIASHGDLLPKLLKARDKIMGAATGVSGVESGSAAFLAVITVAAVISWRAAQEALRARHPRLLFTVQWLPVAWSVVLLLTAWARSNGIVSENLPRTFAVGTFWISGIAIALALGYLCWNGFARRVLTTGYTLGAVGVVAAFGAALWVGTPVSHLPGILYLALGLLLVAVLAPWALGSARNS